MGKWASAAEFRLNRAPSCEDIMFEKQSAIEVTAISRSALQIVSRRHSRSGQHHATQNSCVMAAGRDQHEAVPNSLLEGQSSPKVKTDPGRIEQAPNSNQNRRPSIFRGEHGPHPDQNHPAEYGDGWIGFNLLPDQAAEKIK